MVITVNKALSMRRSPFPRSVGNRIFSDAGTQTGIWPFDLPIAFSPPSSYEFWERERELQSKHVRCHSHSHRNVGNLSQCCNSSGFLKKVEGVSRSASAPLSEAPRQTALPTGERVNPTQVCVFSCVAFNSSVRILFYCVVVLPQYSPSPPPPSLVLGWGVRTILCSCLTMLQPVWHKEIVQCWHRHSVFDLLSPWGVTAQNQRLQSCWRSVFCSRTLKHEGCLAKLVACENTNDGNKCSVFLFWYVL